MRIKLHQIGLQKTSLRRGLKPRLPTTIEGNLKSPVRTRCPVRVELDTGQIVATALVRRSGPGWILTDEADYAVSYANAVPLAPSQFSAVLSNVFSNEADLVSRALTLRPNAEELRDTPTTRELGYTEYLSQNLGYALNECADLTAEYQIAPQDAQRVLVAELSAQIATLLHQMHTVDYRSRIIILPTSHAYFGVEPGRHEIEALAVFVNEEVIHCLPSELPISAAEHNAHIVSVYSLAEEGGRAAKAKRLSNSKAVREHAARESGFRHEREAA